MKKARLFTVPWLLVAAALLAASLAGASGSAPSPDAGADRTVDEDTVTVFTGTAYDPEGDLLSFSWEFPGPTVIDGAEVSFVFPNPGEYTVRFWANDTSSNASDSATVTVRDITPPVPVITGVDGWSVDEDAQVTFEGGSSSDNVEVVNWTWTLEVPGSTVTLYGDTVTHLWATPGVYGVTLVVADEAGNTAQAQVTMDVLDITAPLADFSVSTPCREDVQCSLVGALSSDNVGVANWTWQVEEEDGSITTLYGMWVYHMWATPGTYDVTLTVADAAGNTDEEVKTVEVTDITPPVAWFELESPVGNSEQTLDGADSSDNVGVVSWVWTLEDGGSGTTLTGALAYFTWQVPGTYDITLTVADAAGNTGQRTVSLTVTDTTAPVADAGTDMTVAEDTEVSFDGSGSSDNDPAFATTGTFAWSFMDVSQVSLSGRWPTYTFATPGTYEVTLTVTDAAGNAATDLLTVTVTDVTPPTASFAAPTSAGNDEQALDGSASTDNVGVVSWQWQIQDVGGTATASGQTVAYTWSTPGTFRVTLTVADAAGNTASTSADVVVSDTTPATIVTEAAVRVRDGSAASLDASATTDNDPDFWSSATFAWTFDDGGAQSLSGATASYTFSAIGQYSVTLTVTDPAGNVATALVVVTVVEAVAPAAWFEISSPFGNVAQTLDGSGSTDNVGVVNWTWTLTDSTGQVTLYGATVQYTWMTPGTYSITLTARDAAGNEGALSVDVTVTDTTAPTPSPGSALSVDEDTLFTFDATATTDNDPDFPTGASFTWTFDDGAAQELTGVSPTYTFATPGSYEVLLTVVDAAGNSGSRLFTVVVRDVTAPSAAFTLPTSFDEDQPQALNASASSDNVGVAEYAWTIEDSGGAVTVFGREVTYTWDTPGTYGVTLRVTDAAGNSASTSLAVTVRDVTPPVAAFSVAPSFPEDAAQALVGSSSSDNVGVVNWTWTVSDTTGTVTLYGPTASYTWSTPGSFAVTLQVTDAAGNQGTFARTVTVLDVTPPTVAGTVPAEWPEDAAATFDATGTTDNDPAFPGGALFAWAFNDGGPVTLWGATAQHVFAAPGAYSIDLAVTDAAGNRAVLRFTLVVTDETRPAAVISGPATADEDTEVAFTASPSSDNVGVVSYLWEVEDTQGVVEFTTMAVRHTWATPGTYAVSLTVRDAAGNLATTQRMVEVRDTTAPAVVLEVPASVDEDVPVTLAAPQSTDNVGIVDWRWTVEGGGAPVLLAGAAVTYAFSTPGTYTVRLSAVDAAGNAATAATTVVVRDVTAPDGVADVPSEWPEDGALTLDARLTTDNDPAFPQGAAFTWTFDDHGPVALEGPTVQHTFADPGQYTVQLRVADAAGNVYLHDFTVRVLDRTAPWVTVSSPADGALVGTLDVELTGQVEAGASLTVNGAAVQVTGGTFAATVRVHEGTNYLNFVVTDASGNRATVRWQLEADATAPTLVVRAPAASLLTRAGQVTVEGTVGDTHWGSLSVAGRDVGISPAGTFYAVVQLLEGENTVVVEARDAAGNTARYVSVVTRDSTPPGVTVAVDGTPADRVVLTTAADTVAVTGQTDGAAALELCSGPTPSTRSCRPIAMESDGSWSAQLSLAPGETATVEVRATDAAGNEATTAFAVTREAQAATPAEDLTLWVVGLAAMAVGVVAVLAVLSRRPR